MQLSTRGLTFREIQLEQEQQKFHLNLMDIHTDLMATYKHVARSQTLSWALEEVD